MYHRILIPFDGSARASTAAAMASYLASCTGASLELVYVESTLPDELGAHTIESQMNAELERMHARGLAANARRAFGYVQETTVAVCKELHADLLVLAPQHRNRLSRKLPLGVTEYLLVHSPLPLLLCPHLGPADQEQDHPPHACELLSGRDGLVICPLDGSDVAERALPYAIRLSRQFERTALLVRVVPPPHGFAVSPQASDVLGEARRDEEHAALHDLQVMRHRLLDEQDVREVSVETMLLRGDPAAEILGLSKTHGTSVLVLSTHGRSGLSRMLVGSVTAEIVHRTTVPVFVLPPALAFKDASGAAVCGEAYAVPTSTAIQRTTSAARTE